MPRALNAANYEFETERTNRSDFDTGKDNTNTLQQGEVGEIANAEIGEAGQGSFSSYASAAIGGFPDPRQQTEAGTVFIEAKDDADADLDPATQVRLIARDKNSNRRNPITKWIPIRGQGVSDPEKRMVLHFEGIDDEDWVHKGRILAVEIRHTGSAITPDFSNWTFEIPYVGAL